MNGVMASGTVHGRFAEQAARTPSGVAVCEGDDRLTYRELDQRANQVAHRLRGLGVGPEVGVAVLMERSADLVVAILGILKAGGFYLPVHDAYPLDRMQWILDQSETHVLLADAAMRERGLPRAAHTLLVSDIVEGPTSAPEVEVEPDHLAYVIYTSGSTGTPKGVAVPHQDVLALVFDGIWDSGRHERVLMVAPHAFNVSTYELWVPLLHGGRIVLAPPGSPDMASLRELIRRYQITGVHLTAGLFRVVAEESPESLSGVREVLTGGDVISPVAVHRVFEACPDLVVRAMYGATEATLFSTHAPMNSEYEPGTYVPLGEPMDGVELYVLDDRLTPVPLGVEGELYIGGIGVSRGYYGRPDLTAERFVADPFGGPGRRMYRTGDLARRNYSGELELMGRVNDQVKILGFRVELAEVEAAVAGYPGLSHVAVLARETGTGEKRLVAYVVLESGQLNASALRAHVRSALPEYMTPSAFVAVDSLPLTANGKLDRPALPEPKFESVAEYRAPVGPRQEALCAIFTDVLGVPQLGVDDSIFDVGGADSLTAMRLVSRIRSELGVDLTISTLFDAPTVAGLALVLEESGTSSAVNE